MATQESPTADPLAESALPPRLRWFAPWRWKRRWLIVPALLLAYPMSLGPMVWLHDRQRLPKFASPILHVIYTPLEWSAHQSKWCRAVLDPYVDFWESLP